MENNTIESRLTKEEKDFLEEHGVSLNKTFDVSDMKQKDYKIIMKELDKKVAVFANPCLNGGHRLKDRHGHCIVCKPHNLLFSSRYNANGFVYIAGTLNGEKIKVGFTQNYKKRELTLNSNKYGGYSDWKILFYVGVKNAGKIENEIDKKLEKYFYQTSYKKEGREVATYELFQCSYDLAESVLNDIDKEVVGKKFRVDFWEKYNFKNILNKDDKQTYSFSEGRNNGVTTGKIIHEIDSLNNFEFDKIEKLDSINNLKKESEVFIVKEVENKKTVNQKMIENISEDSQCYGIYNEEEKERDKKKSENNKKVKSKYNDAIKNITSGEGNNNEWNIKSILIIIFIFWFLAFGITVIKDYFVPPKSSAEKKEYYLFEKNNIKGECKESRQRQEKKGETKKTISIQYQKCQEYYNDKIFFEKQKLKK